MFSNETLKLIFIVLQEHCKDETVLEGLRNKNYGKNTNIQDFFKKMDRDNDGFITLLDVIFLLFFNNDIIILINSNNNFKIKEILNESHKNLKEKDICQLFNRFDIKKKGKFGLSEFLNELSSTN